MPDFTILYTKGLPYGLFMKHVILDMTQKGQLHRINTKWDKLTQRDCKPLVQKGKPLSIEKLSSLFFIPLFGFLLTILSLLLEYVLSFFQKKDIVPENELILDKAKIVLTEIRDMDWQICTLTNEKMAELEKIIHSIQKYSGKAEPRRQLPSFRVRPPWKYF